MTNVSRLRTIVLIVVALVLCAGAVRDLLRLNGAAPDRNMVDLSVFYCAGNALRSGENPYDPATIRDCEHRVDRGPAWSNPQYVMYAPLPPYGFVPYEALSRLPFGAAKFVILALIAVAVVVTAFALRSVGVPLYPALAALALSDGFIGMYLGQLYPVTIALVALGAAALHRNKYALAGIAGAATLVQPQIGVFVWCALAIWVSRARVALAVSTAIILSIGGIAAGPRSFFTWVTVAVPLQAAGEVHFWGQYSLTALLGQFGIPVSLAMAAGTVSTVVMLAVALYLAKALTRPLRSNAAIVLVPAACSVVGGSYVHLGAIAVALLAALLVVASDPRRSIVPAALLCVPWPFVQDIKALFLSAVVVLAVVLFGLRGLTKQAIVVFLMVVASMYVLELYPPPDVALGATSSIDWWRMIAKIPTFAALLILLYQFVRLATGRYELRTS
ncbi:MAG TPA: hypothetical protein VGK84_04565 [Candidatus Tumulicola sp.]